MHPADRLTAHMIYLFAILVAFFGGILGGAFRHACHRMLAFFAPVLLCTALMHIPWLMDLVNTGLPPLSWKMIMSVSKFQFFTLLFAALLTGIGWFLSRSLQNGFEDSDDEAKRP